MKFSVVCPVYNAANYLGKAIDSITNQVWEDWELILVDDGSSDNSWQLINDIAKSDNRIKCIHQENMGPGIARNTGIDYATGDFIVFLDSDDSVGVNYLARLSSLADGNDLIFIDVAQVDEDGKTTCLEALSKYEALPKDTLVRWQLTGKIPWGGVRKAVRRSLLVDNDIRYSALRIGEEALFSFRVLDEAKNFAFLKGPEYFYTNRTDSQSRRIVEDPWGAVGEVIRAYVVKSGKENLLPTVNSLELTAAIISIRRLAKIRSGRDLRNRAQDRLNAALSRCGEEPRFDLTSLKFEARMLFPFAKRGLVSPILAVCRIDSAFK